MNKDPMKPTDDWEGVLASRFEEDIQLPPNENWKGVEKELFRTKKSRFAALWIAVSMLLIGGLGVCFFLRPSNSGDKINAKIEHQKVLKKPINKARQKLVLIEKVGGSKRRNRESKVINQLNQSVSNQTKNRESVSLDKKTSFPLKKLDKSSKRKRTPINKQNHPTTSSENPTLATEMFNNMNEEPKNHEKSDNETISNDNISSENSSKNPRNQDSNICLKLLQVQLISTVQSSRIEEVIKKDKIDFKPHISIQVAPLIGRNTRIVSGSFNSNNTNSNALGDRRASLPKYGFQTALNYHFKKRLSLNTSFQLAGGDFQSRWFFKYLQIDPTTNDIRLKTTSGVASTTDPTLLQSLTNGSSGIYKLRINHAFSLYSIPIGIAYRFKDERFSPYFRTALNLEFFGRQTLSLDVLENGIARNIELNLNLPNNRLNLQAMVALGLETSIKKNWSLFTEAGYFLPLNQFVNSNGYSVRIAGSSILVGLKYEFQK
jgi:hypothetical protein